MKKSIVMFLMLVLALSPVAFAASDTEASFEVGQNFSVGGGSVIDELYFGTDTVASGQTSKAVTVTGLGTSARCVVTGAEDPTNDVYILEAAETANTLTVKVSGDPGASNLDFNYICME